VRRETRRHPEDAAVQEVEVPASLLEMDEKSLTLAGTCCNRDRESLADDLGYIPKTAEFQRLWGGKMELEKLHPTYNQKVRGDVKMVMGVMSRAAAADSRKIIRDSWMNQPGVCSAHKGPKEGCAFYTVFVVGGKDTKYQDAGSADIMHVTRDDNIPIFKIREFFKKVVDQYPWATHYGKMDDDTFPHVHKLLPRIPVANKTCESYFGATIPSHGCGLITITPESEHAKERRYACMHGSFFLASHNLVKGMVKENGTIDDFFSGKHQEIDGEDLNFGIALTSYVRQTKTCLNVTEAWMPDNPGGLWDHCGVNCHGITGHGSFR